MSRISLKVNGKPHTVDLDPQTPLLYVLSDELGLRGPKFGCGMAQCGSCTVILRGQVIRSCVMPVSAVGQDEITTLEGLGTPHKPHPLQQAFIDEGAAQCGFCLMKTPLVLWAWNPGEGRTPISMPESEFLAKINEWAAQGAACPAQAASSRPTDAKP